MRRSSGQAKTQRANLRRYAPADYFVTIDRRTGSTTSPHSLGRLRGSEEEESVRERVGEREDVGLEAMTVEDNRQKTRLFSFESFGDIQQNSPVKTGKSSSMYSLVIISFLKCGQAISRNYCCKK